MADTEKEEMGGRSSTDGRASCQGFPTFDCRKEWYCRFCSETNVWTRSKCRMCQANIPSVLQGEYKPAVSTKAGRSCSDSSSSGECEDTVLATRPTGQKRRNHGSCVKKTRGSRRKENRRCSSRTLVKKAGSQKMGRWREVNEEVDSKKKFDRRKKELQKTMAKHQ